MSVTPLLAVPLIRTETPGIGIPSALFLTVPVIVFVCANVVCTNKNNNEIRNNFFIITLV